MPEHARPPTAGELAWLLLAPAAALAVPLVALLAPPLGDVVFAPPQYHYWALELVVPKPTVQAGYVLAVAAVGGYALAILRVHTRRGLPPAWRRGLVLGVQVALLAFLAVAWLAQREVLAGEARRIYFRPATVAVAAALAASATAWIGLRARRRAPGGGRLAARLTSRPAGVACLLLALALTAVWLLPAISTDAGLTFAPADVTFLDRFAFDEATSVLNARSPFVDMAAYASIWPYATALPLRAFGGSYWGFSLLMTALTGAALLALYDVLRRVTRHAPAALALYVPVLATSLFTINTHVIPGIGESRYYPANYFGLFPLRYAGPYLLAWLTVRWIGGRGGRLATAALFAAAGLVALDNIDFGVAALGATTAAVACTAQPATRARLLRLAAAAAAGLAAALLAVVVLTLIRAGSLPQLDVMVVYGRTFASGGYGNLPLPRLGFHLLMSATFVGAVAAAAARTRVRDPDAALTGMLAWSGIFGLGASIYYYAYRSHPATLVCLFSAWALALALLVVAVVRATRDGRRLPMPAEVAVLLGFGLAVCSIAQVPSPGDQLHRIRAVAPTQPLHRPDLAAAVASETFPGQRVAILDAVGHRIAREARVVNVSPYTGLEQIGTTEQVDAVVDLLEREGGSLVFVSEDAIVPRPVLDGALAQLRRRGYEPTRRWSEFVELARR